MKRGDTTFLSNEALLGRYQRADSEAFDEFFNRHKNLIFNFLLLRLRNRADAEDAFQKTFLRIHHYILSYDPGQSALGWVMTIARNVAFDLRARRQSSMSLDKTDPGELMTEPLPALEARSTLEGLLSLLDGKERLLIERRFLSKDSFEEIGRSEGWSPDNARQQVSRLVRKLKAQIGEYRL